MTVSSTIIKTSPFTGDGSTVVFPFTWLVWKTSEIKVILRTVATGKETTLQPTTDYSVSLSGDLPSAGNVTTVATYTSTSEIIIKSDFPQTQEVDYVPGDKFPAESHEEALDRSVRLSQQLQEQFGRAVLWPETTILEDVELPEISSSLVGFFLGVNNAGSGLEWGEPTNLGNLTTHDQAALGNAHTAIIAEQTANVSSTVVGLNLNASSAEVAEGNEQTKTVTPFGLASVFRYDTIQVPAGSLRPAIDNAGTQDTQEYKLNGTSNEATTTRDFVEFGDFAQSGNESIAYDVTLVLPEQWDQAILKAKLTWMAGYDEGISTGSEVAFGLQAKAYNNGSPIDVNWSTPPVYITDLSDNGATNIEWDTDASANIASSVPGSLNRLDVRFTRKNSDDNNATAPVWITNTLFQFRKDNQASGW